MEKLLYLVAPHTPAHRTAALGDAAVALAQHTRGLTLFTTVSEGGGDLPACVLCIWLACLDRRGPFEQALRALGVSAHGYLATESVLSRGQASATAASPASLVLVRSAPRLGQDEWRARQSSEVTPRLRALCGPARLVRDGIVRPLALDAPPLRAVFSVVGDTQPETAQLGAALDGVCSTGQRSVLQAALRVVLPRRA